MVTNGLTTYQNSKWCIISMRVILPHDRYFTCMLKAAGINVYFGPEVEPGEKTGGVLLPYSRKHLRLAGMVRASDDIKGCPIGKDGFCVQKQNTCPKTSGPFKKPDAEAWLTLDKPTSMEKNSGEDGKSLTGDGTFHTNGFVCDESILANAL